MGKYFKYAIGEIILVVAGILIALQINNWNENRKQELQSQQYVNAIISELHFDLYNLKVFDSFSKVYAESIKNYLDYYGLEERNNAVLLQKMDSIQSIKNVYYSAAYTIDDLISSGNLNLLSGQNKREILFYKNQFDQAVIYIQNSNNDLVKAEENFYNSIDRLYYEGLAPSEHSEVKGWKQNLNSKPMRLFNNMQYTAYDTHKYHTVLYGNLIRNLEKQLIPTLKNEQSNR